MSAKTVTTSKGSQLPLLNLKGKEYLQVAYRLQWLSDDNPRYAIETKFLALDETRAVAQAVVTILDANNQVVRRATATKTENAASFGDYAEKSETGAIGRALAMIGLGTQHALADLDEGERIVDSPLEATKKVAPTSTKSNEPQGSTTSATTSRPAPFRSRLKRGSS